MIFDFISWYTFDEINIFTKSVRIEHVLPQVSIFVALSLVPESLYF